ncbi:hypothetical protein [Neobacillus sp. SAB-20_R2A]|uniref:hypothetical protein n=1 Tax=Neobacillus sp. SAB-20_R2A TaxID=3120519 RepID=UPI003C6E2F5F
MRSWKTCQKCGGDLGSCGCESERNLFVNRSYIDRKNRRINLSDIIYVEKELDDRGYIGKVEKIDGDRITVGSLSNDSSGYFFLSMEYLNNYFELKVLFPSDETTFGEEFKKGAIVYNHNDDYDNDLYNGEVIDVSQDRKEIKIKWIDAYGGYEETIVSYPYTPEIIPRVVVTSDSAVFSNDFTEGKVIVYGPEYDLKEDYYHYCDCILEISDDRRLMKVEHLGHDSVDWISYFDFYVDYISRSEYKLLPANQKNILKNKMWRRLMQENY